MGCAAVRATVLTSPGSAVIASYMAEALDEEVVGAAEALVSAGERAAKGLTGMDEMSRKGYVKSTENNWISRRRGYFQGEEKNGRGLLPFSVLLIMAAYGSCSEVFLLDDDRQDELVEALRARFEKTREVDTAAVVRLDVFVPASALPSGFEAERLGAMSAALPGPAERTAIELGLVPRDIRIVAEAVAAIVESNLHVEYEKAGDSPCL